MSIRDEHERMITRGRSRYKPNKRAAQPPTLNYAVASDVKGLVRLRQQALLSLFIIYLLMN